MTRYLARRLLNYLVLLALASFLTYCLTSLAFSPLESLMQRSPRPPQAVIDAKAHDLGLDRPILARYANWVSHAVRGDFGTTITGQPVGTELGRRIGVSLRLLVVGSVFGTVAGVVIGAWGAIRQYRLSDRVMTTLALLQLIDSRSWRDDADLAQVYTAWGGFAYGRDLDGREAIDDMNRQYRRIAVAAKNTDTREHDIADSDDYFQYHGGMVATVRALTGQAPAAYIGDNTRPDAIRTRTLSEETTRVFRARVVNPRWMAAMRRHGYKGAFEMAATVDYLFGYDATAGVMADWMYEQLTQRYVLDAQNRTFMTESNPWALHGMAERLLEAAGRGLWAQPAPETLDGLRQVLLETEGDLEA